MTTASTIPIEPAGKTRRSRWPVLQLAPATVVYVGLFVAPLLFLIAYSVFTRDGFQVVPVLTADHYIEVLTSEVFRAYFLRTFATASMVAVVVVLIAFPFAYLINFPLRAHRSTLYFLVLVALFGGYLVRIYAWRSILGTNGVVNGALVGVGLVDEPITWLSSSQFAIVLALANYLLPLGILPVHSAMQSVSPNLVEAARDLGAGPVRTSLTVVLPLVSKGCAAAFVFAFIGTAADWVTPLLVGGTGDQLIGNQIALQFGGGFNWPLGAALAVVLVLSVAVILGLAALILRRWLR